MTTVKSHAKVILEIAKNIYNIQENNNPNGIFGEKTFFIGTEDNPEEVLVHREYEEKDRSYYFEIPEIDGVIIKRENGNYCIKACVRYTNSNNQDLYFAKIRIENSNDGDINIMGSWSGSWQQPDERDEDQLRNPNGDLPLALVSMKQHITKIYGELSENHELNKNLYDPNWVKKLKRYNN